ncbi:AraC family transcriptional regulator [Agrobacterium rubi]|uniref:helix-turn-helix domain-containing protein n=1 Tax=Agrobacterium rubi TaxID=28099 RepID=UPI00307E738B
MRDFEFEPDQARRSERQLLAHHYMDWGSVRADIVKRKGLSRQETRIVLDRHTFLINLQGEAKMGEDFVDGHPIGFRPRRPGSLIFIPAHHEWTGWDDGDELGAYLILAIDPRFTKRNFLPEHIAALRPVIGFRNSLIESALQRICTEVKNPDAISAVMAESHSLQAVAQLLRFDGVGHEPFKGGLSPFDLKRVMSVIEDRIAVPPSLDELSGMIGVSRRHFSRAFKQSTGKTLYGYISEHRLKKAVDLLRGAKMSATEIAIECGFSSSSHFAFVFKKSIGVRPTEYRRNWRSLKVGNFWPDHDVETSM